MLQTIKSTVITSAITGTLLLSSITPVFAQTVGVATPGAGAQARQQKQQAQCDKMANKINNAIASAQAHVNKWQRTVDQMSQRGQRIGDKINKNDPTAFAQYQTLVNTLTQSLSTVRTDGQNFYNALIKVQQDANSGECGTSQGAFKTDLQAVKTARTQLRKDSQTVRTNFQALKAFVKTLRGTKATGTVAPTTTQ